MKIEIERKFLLASDGWRPLVERSEHIRDGLLSSHDERKVRVRIIGSRATLTVKSGRVRGAREEFEYDIPIADAVRLLELCGTDIIEKVRHYVAHSGLVWEIDEYGGLLEGIILAEVELESYDQVVELPSWVGRDVTAEAGFRKVRMLRARQAGPGTAGD